MEALGLAVAINRIGDTLLQLSAVSKHQLLSLLASADVPVRMKSKLIEALTPSGTSGECMQLRSYLVYNNNAFSFLHWGSQPNAPVFFTNNRDAIAEYPPPVTYANVGDATLSAVERKAVDAPAPSGPLINAAPSINAPTLRPSAPTYLTPNSSE